MIRERDAETTSEPPSPDTPEAIGEALERARAYLSACAEDRLEETAHDPDALARALRSLGRPAEGAPADPEPGA